MRFWISETTQTLPENRWPTNRIVGNGGDKIFDGHHPIAFLSGIVIQSEQERFYI